MISVPWLNFICMHVFIVLFIVTSILSTLPKTLSEKWGQQAWRRCFWLRQVCFISLFIVIINAILWLWFPVPELKWPISMISIIPMTIGVAIAIPFSLIMFKAVKDGGKEHGAPIQETKMHCGIYNYIRHPGALGEMPLYVALGFFLNSWFLVLWMTLFMLIYTPVAIYYEEKDLVKRFGEDYIEYRKRTPALFPRLRRQKTNT
jgi:protein-S-isoprenylcysteine O-methyltransferase Ste14